MDALARELKRFLPVLIMVAAVASFVPARREAGADPLRILKGR